MKIRFDGVIAPLPHFDLELDLELDAGRVAIHGPSGAGKTSLVELIAGLRTPSSGRLLLDDETFAANGVDTRPIRDRGLGYAPQDDVLFTHLSVEHNLLFGQRAEASQLDQVAAALDLQPLLERRTASLSGGERKRVTIARALLAAPRLLLLDEPFTGLDDERRKNVVHLITASGLPFILVTHELEQARSLCEQFIQIDRGRVVGIE
jgi:molybdate transport system ATP-binding protein